MSEKTAAATTEIRVPFQKSDAGRDCIADYFGTWMILDRWFHSTLQAYSAGLLPFMSQAEQRRANHDAIAGIEQSMEFADDELEDDEVTRGPNGMAIIPLRGHLMKGRSSFGGSSTIEARRMVRQSAADSSISGIMLFVESPGGTAAGTLELAEEVRAAADVKPLRAHIQDVGASAAFWIASQADRVTANPLAQVGSIGSVAVVVDSFGEAEQRGLVVHAISTGEFKGAGVPGTKITETHLAKFQQEVNDVNEFFLRGVREGRGLSDSQMRRISTGEIWIASRAETLGLIDGVEPWEQAVESFGSSLVQSGGGAASSDRRRRLEMRERDHRHVSDE